MKSAERLGPGSSGGIATKLGRCGSVVLALCAAGLSIEAARALPQRLAMLSTLERGGWTVRIDDGGAEADRRICLRSGTEFLQIQHRGEPCRRYIMDDQPTRVVIQYSCRGGDFGRTEVRRESADLVQIRSQGTEGGRPFSIRAEGRRSGQC